MEKEWGKNLDEKREWWRQVWWVRARESTASLKEKEMEKGKKERRGKKSKPMSRNLHLQFYLPIHPTGIEYPLCAGNWTRHERRYKGQPERTARGYGLTGKIKACAHQLKYMAEIGLCRKGDRKANPLLWDPEEEVITSRRDQTRRLHGKNNMQSQKHKKNKDTQAGNQGHIGTVSQWIWFET